MSRLNAAVHLLSYKYRTGEVIYPRTGNDYRKDVGGLSLSPHPPLGDIGDFSAGMFFDRYALSKETLPLALANEGISTPATIPSIMAWVDKYYDDDLNRRPELSEQISRALTKLDQLDQMISEQLKASGSSDYRNFTLDSIAKDSVSVSPTPFYFYKISLEPSPKRIKKIEKEILESHHIYRSWRKENFLDYHRKAEKASSFNQAVLVFQQTTFLEEYVRKAEAIQLKNRMKNNETGNPGRIKYGR